MNEVDQIKAEVEANTKTLEKIDTGKKKAAANRDQSLEGRVKVRDLSHRLVNLQKQLDTITKESDPTWPAKTFDKTKQSALKTLKTLSGKLDHADKHLERATGPAPIPTTAPPAEGQADAGAPAAPNPKGIAALMGEVPLVGERKQEATVEVPESTIPRPPIPARALDALKPQVHQPVETPPASDDDDDVVSEAVSGNAHLQSATQDLTLVSVPRITHTLEESGTKCCQA